MCLQERTQISVAKSFGGEFQRWAVEINDTTATSCYANKMRMGTTQTLTGQRFLVAEDEAVIALLLEDVIERCGGTVVATAESCAEVLEVLSAHAIDAIILDVHLQGGTSEEVVAVAAHKNIAVLVCTGSPPHTLSPAFRNLPVLKKPWQGDEFDRALAQLFAEAG